MQTDVKLVFPDNLFSRAITLQWSRRAFNPWDKTARRRI